MMLEANDLHFAYPDSPKLADGLSLVLKEGEFTVLLGPNGCGKSTLFRMLTGELIPQSGDVLLDGIPVRSYAGRERAKRIGAVMQSAPPVLDFSVSEYVNMGRSPRQSAFAMPSAEDRAEVEKSMALFDVSHLADHPCNILSGGERQRVMLASVWANSPDIFLLDEPTSATDPAHSLQILRIFRQKSKEKAVFMISHDLMLAANFADRLLLMHHGKIFAAGTPDEVLTPENIFALYNIKVQIIRTSQGKLAVLPDWKE